MRNCAVSGNSAAYGGGIRCFNSATVQNCTVSRNSATTQGGGVNCASGGTLVNTVVFANTGCNSSNVYASGTGMSFTNCCSAPAVSGTGNIAADPKFVNAAAGDYRLQAESPCIDAGLTLEWMSGATDLDGIPRILGGTADMGAYEADYHVVTVVPGTNGTVSPSGTFRMLRGQPLRVTFAPYMNYYVADVLIDGQSVGVMTGYTFENVTNDHTISATFLPSPAVTYVAPDGAHVYPYDTWEKAASNLQAAVDAVDTGGTVWVTNGVYAAGGATVFGMSNRVALTRTVTLQSVNGPDVTFIRGQGPLGAGAVRCAFVTNGAVLAGFTLTNGYTRTSGDTYREQSGGGALLYRGGTVSNCKICGSSANEFGGGVKCSGSGKVQNCVVGGNSASVGGGVYCESDVTVWSCRVSGNSANKFGGGIYCANGGNVQNCVISGNSATNSGGGVHIYYNGTLQDCMLKDNTAPLGGGVCCVVGGTVKNCIVSGNSASSGGGVHCQAGTTVQNCAVSGNTASAGGGVYCNSGGTVKNCTVSGNTASYRGGGVYCLSGGALVNTIIYFNSNGVSPNVGTNGTGMSFTTCCTTPAAAGTGNIASDPKFVNAATGNYRLQTNSPCIDAGFNEAWMVGATDLDGKPRVLNGTADIGAYEAGFTITASADVNGAISPSGELFVRQGQSRTVTVTPDADYYITDVLVDGHSMGPSAALFQNYTFANVTNFHTVSATFLARPTVAYVSTNGASLIPYDTWEKAAATIQDAADYVRTGGTVWVTNGVYASGGAAVYGMSNRVALTRAVTLQSVHGPDVTFIQGQGPLGAGAVRCAYLTNGAALVGFTLTNGFTRTSGDGDFERSGGGAWLDRGGTVQNCTASGNKAYRDGGALYCYYGGTVQNCTISGNTAGNGGGIYNYQGGTERNCTISGNKAIYGGGIWCERGGTVLFCTLNSNNTDFGGGGVYCNNGGTVLICVINGNKAGVFGGGGVRCVSGGTVQNCTVSGNLASDNAGGVYCTYGGTVVNTVVFANTGGSSPNVYAYGSGMSFTNCCTAPAVAGIGNIAADPLFVNAAAGDYRLQTNSPCINAGTNQTGMAGATDLDGRPRVIQGIVDIGAYEALLPGWDEDADGLPDEWEWDRARTLTGLAPDADADGDGADNLAEYGADTDPFSGSSLLELTLIAPEAGGMRVVWRGGRNAWQFLERSTNLSAGASGWTAVYTNAPPTALSAEALDAAPAEDKAFYRVRAQR